VLLEATTDPDRAAAKRAMEAMMTMRKIDIATIPSPIQYFLTVQNDGWCSP